MRWRIFCGFCQLGSGHFRRIDRLHSFLALLLLHCLVYLVYLCVSVQYETNAVKLGRVVLTFLDSTILETSISGFICIFVMTFSSQECEERERLHLGSTVL